ncbi:VOC family protein [Quadrisphaera setariae]|uniref:VOC family protein n=1 Tax=Quadrisphaera setariae TaxID=2593304 RepID=A0A5C8ZFD6_9ACTN|nr:VOC family protein [Quadrisphaera setariae]
MPSRISIVTLGVADLARATAFYEALGWRRRPESQPTISFFDNAGSMLALFEQGALAEDARLRPPSEPAQPGAFRGATYAINCDSDDDVLAVLAAAEAAGATTSKPAERSPFFDGLDGYFLDPDGHAWEVAHNPDLHGLPR